MNCGCLLEGNPFDGNQKILEACVLHLVWAGEQNAKLRARVKELEEAPLNLPGAAEAKKAVSERDALVLQVEGLTKLLRRAEDVLGPDRTATERKATLMEIGKHLTEKPNGACTRNAVNPTLGHTLCLEPLPCEVHDAVKPGDAFFCESKTTDGLYRCQRLRGHTADHIYEDAIISAQWGA